MFVRSLERGNEYNPLMGKSGIKICIQAWSLVCLSCILLIICCVWWVYPLNARAGKCKNCHKLSLWLHTPWELKHKAHSTWTPQSTDRPVICHRSFEEKERKHTIASSSSYPFCERRRVRNENEHIASELTTLKCKKKKSSHASACNVAQDAKKQNIRCKRWK